MKFLILLCIIVFYSYSCLSGIDNIEQQKKVEKLYNSMQLGNIAKEIPEIASSYLLEFQADFEEKKFEALYQSAVRAYAQKLIYQEWEHYVLKHYNEKMIDTIYTWMSSELYQKPLRFEHNETTAKEVNTYYDLIKANPDFQSRIKRIEQLMSENEDNDIAVENFLYIHESIMKAVNPFFPEKVKLGEHQIQNVLRHLKAGVTSDSIKADLVEDMLYEYKNLTDAELESYLGFFQTKAGKWMNKMFPAAFRYSLDMARNRLKVALQANPLFVN